MDSEANATADKGAYSLPRLVLSTVVLVALAGAGWVYFYGVPDVSGGAAAEAVPATAGTETAGSQAAGGGIQAPPAQAVPVETAIARRADLVKTITASGNAESTRELAITAPVSGIVAQLGAHEGDVVQEGQLLVTFADAELRLSLQKARERLVQALAQYQVKKAFLVEDDAGSGVVAELQQAQEQVLAGALSPEQFKTLIDDPKFYALFTTISRDEVMAAQDGLLTAVADYATAELNVERAIVTAPFAGQIASTKVVEGQNVRDGIELLTLVDADPIRVRVEVLESEAGLARLGRAARVRFAAYPSETFRGQIDTISPLVDAEKKTLQVIVSLPNPDLRLKPGMFAWIDLDTEIFPDRLLVPSAAVLLRDERPMVFVVEDGRARWVYIRKGLENPLFVEVLEGVEPGNEVVVSGHYSLAHDAAVRVVEPEEQGSEGDASER